MVDYNKLLHKLENTIIALSASAIILWTVQQYQKNQSQKAFDKLPKDAQEVIIKIKESRISDKIIQINIDSYNKITKLGELFKSIIKQDQKIDSIKLTNKNEIKERLSYKNQQLLELININIEVEKYEKQLDILDKENAEVLKKSIGALITDIRAQIVELLDLINK